MVRYLLFNQRAPGPEAPDLHVIPEMWGLPLLRPCGRNTAHATGQSPQGRYATTVTLIARISWRCGVADALATIPRWMPVPGRRGPDADAGLVAPSRCATSS